MIELFNCHKLFRFVIVGVLTFVVNVIVFKFFYTFLEFSSDFAISVAYFLQLIAHYVLSKIFTFRAGGIKHIRCLPRYVLMVIVNYLLTVSNLSIVETFMHIDPVYSIFLSACTNAVSSFLIMNNFVFRNKS